MSTLAQLRAVLRDHDADALTREQWRGKQSLTVRNPRDYRAPAPRFWPQGIPAGVTFAVAVPHTVRLPDIIRVGG